MTVIGADMAQKETETQQSNKAQWLQKDNINNTQINKVIPINQVTDIQTE